MKDFAHSLVAIAKVASNLKQVRKEDLDPGDWVLIITRNSRYTIKVLGENLYWVSGGWLDRKGFSPLKTTINGCTWGGRIIKTDIVAACGLCLEFGNRVVTSTIRKILVIRNCRMN